MNTDNFSTSKKRKLSATDFEEETIVSELEALKAENEKLKQIIEKQKATIIDLAMDNTELKKEKTCQSKLIKEYESEISRLKPIVENLEKTNSTLIQKESKIKEATIKNKTRMHCMKFELASLNIVSNQIQTNLKRKFQSKIDQLQTTVDNLTKKNLNLNKTIESERKMFKAKSNESKMSADADLVMRENLTNAFAKIMADTKRCKPKNNVQI